MTQEEFQLMKDVINEVIQQHNGLVAKVDELCNAVNEINAAIFNLIDKPDQLDS